MFLPATIKNGGVFRPDAEAANISVMRFPYLAEFLDRNPPRCVLEAPKTHSVSPNSADTAVLSMFHNWSGSENMSGCSCPTARSATAKALACV